MTERWLPVVGWEGLYEVSDQGRVRSLPREVNNRWGTTCRRSGRLLAPVARKDGYLHVTLYDSGKQRHRPIHVLVLEAFVGPRPDGHVACHWDGDRRNASLGNLRWDTPAANSADMIRHGTVPGRSKTHCPRNHLLVEPNLVRSNLKLGWRMCRACHQAHQRPALDMQAESDRRYALIMGGGEGRSSV